MYHSITFTTSSGSKNTWDDLHLYPTSRPVFNPPTQKTKIIDIPGADSSLDLSEALTGYPIYNDRQGPLEFIVANDFKNWVDAYSDIMNYLHGQVAMAILEDDPLHYYLGRFTINNWKSDKKHSLITLDYQLQPYKYSVQSSVENVIQKVYFNNISVTGTTIRNFPGIFIGRQPVCPTFVVTSNDNNGFDILIENEELNISVSKHLTNGEHIISEFILSGINPSNNVKLTVTGNGSLSLIFRSGGL